MLKRVQKGLSIRHECVDSEFESLIKQLGLDGKFNADAEIHQTGAKYKSSIIKPGEPLHFISSLANHLLIGVINKKADSVDNLSSFMRIIQRWIKEQTEKLECCLVDENKDLSEFHMAKNQYNDLTCNAAFSFVLEVLLSLISELYVRDLYKDGLIEYCKLLKSLSKVLRLALDKDKVLHKLKHKPAMKNTLNVIDFEVSLGILNTLVVSNEYFRAEAFVNKTLFYVESIHNSEKDDLKYLLYSLQALIGAETKDVGLVLQALRRRKDHINGENAFAQYLKKFECDYSAFCFLAETYRLKEEYQTALAYYNKACNGLQNLVAITDVQKEMRACLPDYVMQLAKLALKKCPTAIQKVQAYKKACKLKLNFCDKKYADQFYNIMHSKKESVTRNNALKTEQEKCAVEINVSFDLGFENFKTALDRVNRTLARDEAKKAKEKIASKKMPEAEYASAHHNQSSPYVDVLYWNKDLYKVVKKKSVMKSKRKKNASKRKTVTEEKLKLEPIQFPKSSKIFDPETQSDMVTLSVNGMTERWYAFLNPKVLELIPYKEEVDKLLRKFNEKFVLSGDMCKPCFKEFPDKTFVFKIRLLGHGKGDIRIYAEHIETVGNKKLVVFTAINTKAHVKGTQPKYIPLADDSPVEKISKVVVEKMTF